MRFGRTHAWIDGRIQSVDLGVRDGGLRISPSRHGDERSVFGQWLAFPGMINAHDHLHLNAFPSALEGAPYLHALDWVEAMRERIESPNWTRIREIDVAERAWQGGIKNLLAGATTVLHHDPWLKVFDQPDFPVDVVRDFGWAHSVGLAADGGYGPVLETAIGESDPQQPFVLHLAEGRDQRASSELAALEAAGGLRSGTCLVHGIGLSASDRERALNAGAALIYCPSSNDRLIGAVASTEGFLAANQVALGTDARLTGSRDLLDELSVVRGRLRPAPAQWIGMVFEHAARIVGLPSHGRFTEEAPADLMLVPPSPKGPVESLVNLRRAELGLVMRGGKPMIADHEFVGLFEATGEAWLHAELDGRAKLVSERVFGPLFRADVLEPGLRRLESGPSISQAPFADAEEPARLAGTGSP